MLKKKENIKSSYRAFSTNTFFQSFFFSLLVILQEQFIETKSNLYCIYFEKKKTKIKRKFIDTIEIHCHREISIEVKSFTFQIDCQNLNRFVHIRQKTVI